MSQPDRQFTYDVFISYSHKDRAWVRDELLPRLEASGLRVCIDFRDFEPGAPSVKEMEGAVEHSRKTLLILTPHYLDSAWAEFEYVMLQTLDPANRTRRLIPLLKAPCDPPLSIRSLTYISFTEPGDQQFAWNRLITTLGGTVPQQQQESTSPSWYLAHPYPMPPHFTGRAAEMALLNEWMDHDREYPIFIVEALGGFGKSALTWHWLTHHISPDRWPRVVWWSFYEQDASFERFLPAALKYLGINPGDRGLRDQVDLLLAYLHRHPALLIFDGFERALRAFSGLGAAYQGDDERDPGTPSARDCVSPLAEHLLYSMATLPNLRSKLLLTTRLRPRILQDRADDTSLLVGCRELKLEGMAAEDSVAFFQSRGVKGTRAEIMRVCQRYGYHPLTLRLLAGKIVKDLRQPGDIAVAERLDISGDIIQRRTHVLQQAYDSLTRPHRQLLSRIACFRGPVTYDTLAAVMPASTSRNGRKQSRQGLSHVQEQSDLDTTLAELIERGLLQRTGRTFDLHPIVRRYAYDRLADSERRRTHDQLRNYFEAVDSPASIYSLDDIQLVIELYHHTVRAGQYDAAFTLYKERISEPLYFQLSEYEIIIELLRALFPYGEDQPPQVINKGNQSTVMNDLANSYSKNGQSRRSIMLFERSLVIDDQRNDMVSIAVELCNLANDQLKIGTLKLADGNLRRSITLRQAASSSFRQAVGRHELGHLLTYCGAWDEAEVELTIALSIFEDEQEASWQSIVWASLSLRGVFLMRVDRLAQRDVNSLNPLLAQSTIHAAQQALELVDKSAFGGDPRPLDHVRAYWLLGAAHRLNGEAIADKHLTEALTRCRRINLVEMEADILIELARLRIDQGKHTEALRLAEEALRITERCEYVLQGADAHLVLAELALHRGARAEAREHARRARELATCDGPPDYTYKVAYEEAGAMLERLDAEG